MSNGKAQSKKASKAASLQQQVSEGDLDMEELTGRSNTATPGPSEDDIQSESTAVAPCVAAAITAECGRIELLLADCIAQTSVVLMPGHIWGFASSTETNCYQPVHIH